MILELSQLPMVVQQQLTEAKTPVEIVSNGKVVATLNPAFETMAKKCFIVRCNRPFGDKNNFITFDC